LSPGKLTILIALVLCAVTVAGYGTGFASAGHRGGDVSAGVELSTKPDALPRRSRSCGRSARPSRRSGQKSPRGTYLIIDQTLNRLYLKKDDETVLEAKCSAGSGMVLEEGEARAAAGSLDTPRGQFKVLQKISDPVWKKPDWAFVEEGKPIPAIPTIGSSTARWASTRSTSATAT
jgi:hypothetical protein